MMRFRLATAGLLAAAAAYGQATTERPAFEAADIHVSAPAETHPWRSCRGGAVPSAAEPAVLLTLSEAVEKQLRLKLTAQKYPMPSIVIDHVQRPRQRIDRPRKPHADGPCQPMWRAHSCVPRPVLGMLGEPRTPPQFSLSSSRRD